MILLTGATPAVFLARSTAAVQVRTEDPSDDKKDMDLPIWAGILPMQQTIGSPQAAADLREGLPVPSYLTDYSRPAAGLEQKFARTTA